MSHLDTYRTQSGPQTRRERVQPTATGPLQSPLCVRGRRNPARDPRFPITADPHPSPHLTLDSTASRLTCPLTCATAPPETATGTAAASTAATTGEEVRRPNHLRSAGAFFPTRQSPTAKQTPGAFPQRVVPPVSPTSSRDTGPDRAGTRPSTVLRWVYHPVPGHTGACTRRGGRHARVSARRSHRKP